MHKLGELLGFAAELRRALRQARAAAGDNGVSVPRQLYELIRLRAGPGKLSPDDYYLMRVYRRDRSFSEKRRYLSPPAFGALSRDRRWGIVADDKLLTYALLKGQGFTVPGVHAIFHPSRTFASARCLRSKVELQDYLTSAAPYPFFAKPIQGIYSRGTVLVDSLDRGKRVLRLGDGSDMPLEAFVALCAERPKGFLFQELLHPHPAVAEICGDRLCTVRMIVLLADNSPRLLAALWKIAGAGNVADNYWREGNMLGLLDRETGTVRRCTTGLGSGLREVDRHPATGRALVGFALPDWKETVELTLRASRVVPALPVQAWDIAVTPEGPMPLEVNIFGSPFLPQIANDAGLLDGEFGAFMDAQRGLQAQRGCKGGTREA